MAWSDDIGHVGLALLFDGLVSFTRIVLIGYRLCSVMVFSAVGVLRKGRPNVYPTLWCLPSAWSLGCAALWGSLGLFVSIR